MPVQFGTLIRELALKAGVKADNPKLVELLSVGAQIPDEIAGALKSLIAPGADMVTLEVAKNHPDLLKHFNATIFNGMDAKILALANEDGDLSPTDLAEIKAEKNSYEKLRLLKQKVRTSIEGKHTNPADKQLLLDEIKKLTKEVADAKTGAQTEIEQAQQQFEHRLTDYAVESLLAAQPYANTDIPAEVNILTAKNLVNKVLADKKAILKRDADGKLVLKNAENPELDFLENNTHILFSDLAISTLANNKLLKVSDSPAANKTLVFKTPTRTPADGSAKGPDYSRTVDANAKHLADLGVTA
jgi:hypothetical protein